MKTHSRTIALLATAALLLMGSGTDSPDSKPGTILGIVSESGTGRALPGASVVIVGTTLGTFTDGNGRFKITKVPVGVYEVQASFAGYHVETIKGVVVCSDCDVRVVFNLKPGGKLDEIVVENERPLVGRDALRVRKERDFDALLEMAAIPSPFTRGYHNRNFNTEEYEYIEESGFIDPRVRPLSTFSIDVDAASYANMRRFITSNQRPPVDAIRTEELVNYFDYDYPQPDGKHPVAVFTELGVAPWNPDNLLMHIGLQAEEIPEDDLRPSNLVFLLDVSGSMDSPDKIGLLKKSFKLLTNELTVRDRVAIVVYAGAAGLVLPPTRGDKTETIRHALEQLRAGGSTAGGAGIELAYKIAGDNLIPNGNNRIILATDGDFNVGVSATGDLVRMIKDRKDEGIGLTVLGFGSGNLKDSRMETLADKGDGNYYYIDSLLEGKKVFVDQLRSTLYTVARDVKVQVEFNPAVVGRYRLIGYENRALNAEDFADDKKDAGEMGSGHTVTALYEIVLAENVDPSTGNELRYQQTDPRNRHVDEIGTVKIRYKPLDSDRSTELSHFVLNSPAEKTSDNFGFSASVAMFSMLLRDSDFLGETTASSILELARNSKGSDEYGYRAEFIRLVETFALFEIADARMIEERK